MEKSQRDAVIEHATQTKQAAHDPSSFLTELHNQQQQYYSIQWLTQFDIWSFVPLPPHHVAYETVSSAAKVPLSILRSVARMAMTNGLLRETSDGNLMHTALSASFVTDEHLRTQLRHFVNATIPIMANLAKATERWGGTTAPNETAYAIANATELSFFEHLKANPQLQKNFEKYMKSRAVSHTGSNVEYLLDAFDWNELNEATVVDVGGSSGSTAIMLATTYPHLSLVIQDLPAPIESARERLGELPEQIRARIKAHEHDFFQSQPQAGADIYLLRTILHDWPDDAAVKILKNLVESMGSNSRLLIMDMVLPKPGTGWCTHEAALRQKDLIMRGTFNSKEREVDEWNDLLRKTDARLRIVGIERPVGSELSVIEVALDKGSDSGRSEWHQPTVNGASHI